MGVIDPGAVSIEPLEVSRWKRRKGWVPLWVLNDVFGVAWRSQAVHGARRWVEGWCRRSEVVAPLDVIDSGERNFLGVETYFGLAGGSRRRKS
jgi:hypothetical protein